MNITITKADIDAGKYTKETKIEIDGDLIIEASLGWVSVLSISVKGSIVAKAGSGIKAGLVNWRLPEVADLEIRATIRRGTVALGNVVAPAEKDVKP